MNKCPHCSEETIGNSTKMCLGPARSVRCSNCNKKVSISWWSPVIVLVVMMILFFIKDISSPLLYFGTAILLLIIYLSIHTKFLPLIARKENK